MPTKHRSARGEIVDLDLLRIKTELALKPPTPNAMTRNDYVNGSMKQRRRQTVKQRTPVPEVEARPTATDVVPEKPKKQTTNRPK